MPLDLAQAESWFGAEPATSETPESLFEKRWAHAVMEAALLRLREECLSTGKTKVYELLSPFFEPRAVFRRLRGGGGKTRHRAAQCGGGCASPLRADYRAMVREEVAAGLCDGTRVG